jgi:DNA-binding transcriptional MerR regulator/methylmalonyl-CoA mutase cobalamin-binding subunit
MAQDPQSATFNLGAILQETGIKADTLRAWERRYGLPQPQRSAGGHRLYSRRDIEIVKWLMARQEERLSISQAVKLWKNLVSEGQDPLRMPQYAEHDVAVPAAAPAAGETITDFMEAWVSACKAYDESQAEMILSQAFALYPPEVVCFQVVLSGMEHIGEEWYRGTVRVQQEHFASQLATRRLEALVAAAPSPTRNVRLMVAAPPGEEHDLVLLLAELLLRRRGLDVIYLGRNVPLADLEVMIAKTRPALVISAAQRLVTAGQLRQMVFALRNQGIVTYYGGRIFNRLPRLRAMLPAHFLGERFEPMTQVIEAALTNPIPPPAAKPLPPTYQQALDQFRRNAGFIGNQVQRAVMDHPGVDKPLAQSVVNELSESIEAGLVLGDVRLAEYELQWLVGGGQAGRPEPEQLSQLIEIYRRAAGQQLGEPGKLVLDWLAEVSVDS